MQEIPQKETRLFYSFSPHATAKLYADYITEHYHETCGVYACNHILFNYETPVCGEIFVTREIACILSRIELGLQSCFCLANLNSKLDWGHARDYVEMEMLVLQEDQSADFVIALGAWSAVHDFVNAATKKLGRNIRWICKGVDEKDYLVDPLSRARRADPIVRIDPLCFRLTEVKTQLCDLTSTREKLGWNPRTSFEAPVAETVCEDPRFSERAELVKNRGYTPMDNCQS